MKLSSEAETLFIPLLAKAEMSKNHLFLRDPKAESIISEVDYDFSKLKQSKWLSMFLSLRAQIIDELCNKFMLKHPNPVVIHLGCGLDSRCVRVSQNYKTWYDIDYQSVINIRKSYYDTNSKHQMIGSSVTNTKWLTQIPNSKNVLVVAEGFTMYLSENEIKNLLSRLNKYFANIYLIFDAYTKKGVRYSRIKNPVKKMHAKVKYGIDKPEDFLKLNSNLKHVSTHPIKKDTNNLPEPVKFIFNHLYCGKISQSLYKIYEFKLENSSNNQI